MYLILSIEYISKLKKKNIYIYINDDVPKAPDLNVERRPHLYIIITIILNYNDFIVIHRSFAIYVIMTQLKKQSFPKK